jgi:hypothetical protein
VEGMETDGRLTISGVGSYLQGESGSYALYHIELAMAFKHDARSSHEVKTWQLSQAIETH